MNSTPTSLVEFLQTLLTGSSKVGNNPSQMVQRLTASFSQDLVYAVTCNKVKPTKHIVLPFAVKSLTGNVELIKILNRLSHGVSYSQAEEIDTPLPSEASSKCRCHPTTTKHQAWSVHNIGVGQYRQTRGDINMYR